MNGDIEAATRAARLVEYEIQVVSRRGWTGGDAMQTQPSLIMSILILVRDVRPRYHWNRWLVIDTPISVPRGHRPASTLLGQRKRT